ncbi:MAG: MarC family transcriptional regulator [Proteobacteria bacterium]|nr:MAG: MarC family transcriptional regulator [Pseudomonadota bacterium]
MPSFDLILNAFVTLFVTVDPIGNVPVFLSLTVGLSSVDRRSVALRGVVVAFAILTLFAITGTAVLDAMGITVSAFRVAGGLLLFYTAFEMIYEKRQERKEEVSKSVMKEHIANIAVFPLAIPLLAGPGTISATILLSSELSHATPDNSWVGVVILVFIIFALLLMTAFTLTLAEMLDKYIGNTGKKILTRLLGVLLAALSVQYVADGALALFGNN